MNLCMRLKVIDCTYQAADISINNYKGRLHWKYIVNFLLGNSYILYIQDAITFILNYALKTVLCTTEWLAYNQHKKVYQIIQCWYLKVFYTAWFNGTCRLDSK